MKVVGFKYVVYKSKSFGVNDIVMNDHKYFTVGRVSEVCVTKEKVASRFGGGFW